MNKVRCKIGGWGGGPAGLTWSVRLNVPTIPRWQRYRSTVHYSRQRINVVHLDLDILSLRALPSFSPIHSNLGTYVMEQRPPRHLSVMAVSYFSPALCPESQWRNQCSGLEVHDSFWNCPKAMTSGPCRARHDRQSYPHLWALWMTIRENAGPHGQGTQLYQVESWWKTCLPVVHQPLSCGQNEIWLSPTLPGPYDQNYNELISGEHWPARLPISLMTQICH